MYGLGFTRSANRSDHLLQTSDTFVRAPLPQILNGLAIVHVNPARGAKFLQYTAELEKGGSIDPAPMQRFAYVLEGELDIGSSSLRAGDYVYCPAGFDKPLLAETAARVAVIEKDYRPLPRVTPPGFFKAREAGAPSLSLGGNPKLQVRSLLPSSLDFDLAVNIMVYQPGTALPMVEIHVMEHGLLMLEGGGIFRLGDSWYPVNAGDFIWMAPYCPQWFGALGDVPTKYLIYKDWNR